MDANNNMSGADAAALAAAEIAATSPPAAAPCLAYVSIALIAASAALHDMERNSNSMHMCCQAKRSPAQQHEGKQPHAHTCCQAKWDA
jgi:hypothetical protein